MKEKLTSKHADLIKDEFCHWIDDLARDKKNVGEILAEIWNQYSEDKMNESQMLLDLTKKDDFATLFIDGKYIDVAREKGLPKKEDRWVMVSLDTYNKTADEIYTFFNEAELVKLCIAYITDIAECVIAWPSLYSRDFYEAIIWPILKKEEFLDLCL